MPTKSGWVVRDELRGGRLPEWPLPAASLECSGVAGVGSEKVRSFLLSCASSAATPTEVSFQGIVEPLASPIGFRL